MPENSYLIVYGRSDGWFADHPASLTRLGFGFIPVDLL